MITYDSWYNSLSDEEIMLLEEELKYDEFAFDSAYEDFLAEMYSNLEDEAREREFQENKNDT